ncbi:hypothetical protein AB0E69_08850 [Kribbella sp. NPDC026611]|uniref:hypothetical protein n=1 Tax=Kribbella sp. NPDC026611 TaxID=3154911 RepID=UPI0033D4B040
MSTNDYSGDPALRDLEVEVDADIELNAEGSEPYDDLGSPDGWLLDPVEAQIEAVELESLHGAIVALEGGSGEASGPAVSSG